MEELAAAAGFVSPSPNPGQPCLHKVLTGCMLTALPCCCSCADQRPHATAYPIYIDGQGMRLKGRRWQRYCRRCCDFWQSLVSAAETTARPRPDVQHISSPLAPHQPATDRSRPPSTLGNVAGSESPSTSGRNSHQANVAMPDSETIGQGHRPRDLADHRHPEQSRPREQTFPLGTREDVQQDDYESPIFGMFSRAWTRYRDAEEVRNAARALETQENEVTADAAAGRSSNVQYDVVHNAHMLDLHLENIPPPGRQPRPGAANHPGLIPTAHYPALFDRPPGQPVLTRRSAMQDMTEQFDALAMQRHLVESSQHNSGFQQQSDTLQIPPPTPNPLVFGSMTPTFPPTSAIPVAPSARARRGFHAHFYSDALRHERFGHTVRHHTREAVTETVDEDDGSGMNPIDRQSLERPPPLSPDDLKADITCKVCREQRIDSLVMPCMHAAMCHWCAALWKQNARSANGYFDHRLWTCIVCRRPVKEQRRFFL